MTRILIIGQVWPEPTSSAAGQRILELIHLFQEQKWCITFTSAASITTHTGDLERLGVSIASIALNCSTFDRFVEELQPHVVLFDRFMTEEQFSWRVEAQAPNALRVLDTEDLHCLRDARHRALKAKKPFQESDLKVSQLAPREIASILRSDLSLMISHVEVDLLQRVFLVDPSLLHHVPFLIDPPNPFTRQRWPSYAERDGFIFIGHFHHAPNWDAIRHLKQDIWPLIRKQLPDATLRIYGAYMPPKAMQLHNPKQGFHVLGWIQDAQAATQQSRITLAPLRFGAGIKGKLVEAMCCGTPSVTTPIGAESMHSDLPWNGAIAETPQEIADAAVQLHQDEARWQEAQEQGLRILEVCYGKAQGAALIEKMQALHRNLEQHRSQNFMGAMLRHHTMKSTKYMALWIEEKNKPQASSE